MSGQYKSPGRAERPRNDACFIVGGTDERPWGCPLPRGTFMSRVDLVQLHNPADPSVLRNDRDALMRKYDLALGSVTLTLAEGRVTVEERARSSTSSEPFVRSW